MSEEQLDEPILPDDYPVYPSYLYVLDGQVRSSPIRGTVRELRREEKAEEVRRCDIVGRGLFKKTERPEVTAMEMAIKDAGPRHRGQKQRRRRKSRRTK